MADEVEEDEDALLEEGDPIAALIDRIESVKTSFEQFSKGLKDDGLADDDDDDDDDAASKSDADLAGDAATADMETKIARFEGLLERLSDVVSRMEASEDELGYAEAEAEGEEEDDDVDDDDDDDYASLGNNPVVSEYEALIQRLLVPFLDAVNGIGGEVQKQGSYVAQVFGAQREMLVQVSRMAQPSEEDFMQMLETTNEALACIDQVCCVCVCLSVCLSVCVCLSVGVYTYPYICVCMCVRICVHTCIHTYIHINVHTYISYTHTHTHRTPVSTSATC